MNCHCSHSKEEHSDDGMCIVCLCGQFMTVEDLEASGKERLENCSYPFCEGKKLKSKLDRTLKALNDIEIFCIKMPRQTGLILVIRNQ